MPTRVRPIVAVSRCLGYEPCRWNGEIEDSPIIQELKPYVDVVTICPEADIGLGVPREPINLHMINGEIHAIQMNTWRDVTELLKRYADEKLMQLRELDAYILKSRSPSCGVGNTKLYDEKGSTLIGNVDGVFTQAVKDRSNKTLVISDEDVERLGVEGFLELVNKSRGRPSPRQ
ncbi:MAG: DUF523 domain-containing protein [Candidatus Bathyarchaeota archaeon]|nr:DUF523 domain-containing protein [Candidatus Bathyarchaeota archaeon]